jgi:Fic family protein
MWNYQQQDWPNFSYNKEQLKALEDEFLYQTGLLVGAYSSLNKDSQNNLVIELLSDEALKTSEIEGEYLNRDSVQSSVKKHFGIQVPNNKVPKAEQGIAQMMLDLYANASKKLSEHSLGRWHKMLTDGRRDIKNCGTYRNHPEAMQVISGPIHNPKVHFQAPDSVNVPHEMKLFINWFNESAPTGAKPLPPLIRAGIAHLYFVSIHPFEDGNGRIARALAIKALASNQEKPILIALSTIIQKNKKTYYKMLEDSNKGNEITNWLNYFSKTIIAAGNHSINSIKLIIKKAQFFEQFNDALNERQKKMCLRIFAAGIDGFEGGLSAEKYINLTNTSRATATRDLQDLVNKKILRQEGTRKSTRYYLEL